MKNIRHIALITAFVSLGACATTTPYQEASKPGAYNGYSETLIEQDRARVTFAANSITDRETVETYLIYRAAELTKEKGYDYFTLVERDTDARVRLSGTSSFGGSSFFSHGFIGRGGFGFSRFGRGGRFSRFGGGFNRFGGGFDTFHTREIKKYRSTAEIKLHRGATPDAENAYDAEDVLATLSEEIVFPEETANL